MIPKFPLVSVLVLTYNHQDFVEKALMGIINQQCTFELELIIANDFSQDNTDLVIRRVLEKHSNMFLRIRYICKNENVGVSQIVKETLFQCEGKYIAICEGDDFWTDCFKLEKQINFLNENTDYIICGSRVIIDKIDGKQQKSNKKIGQVNLKDSLYQNQFSTCSVVFRRQTELEAIFLNKFDEFYVKDWALWTSLLRFGKGYNLIDLTATYNEHANGKFSSITLEKKLLFFLKDRMLMIYNFPDKRLLIKSYAYKILLSYLKKSILKKEYYTSLKRNRRLIVEFFRL